MTERPNVPEHEKFQQEDDWYLHMRQELLQPGQWELVDNAPIWQGPQHIARRLAVYEIVKQTLDVPGDIMEFGCWHGANLLWMAKCLQVLSPQTYKHVWGFDTWEGLQEATFTSQDNVDAKSAYADTYIGNYQRLEDAVRLQRMDDWVHLVKGNVTDIARDRLFLNDHPHVLVSLAYMDMDLYQPTLRALEDIVLPRLVPGGVVVFDEAGHPSWPGEVRAMLKTIGHDKGGFTLHTIPFARQPTLYVVKQ